MPSGVHFFRRAVLLVSANVNLNLLGGLALAACRRFRFDRLLAMPPPVSRVLPYLAAFALLLAACGGPSWQELKAPDGGFRVLMRGDPQVEKRDLDTPIGKITGHWYSTERNDAVFGVGYADYPADFVQNAPPRQIFTIVREGWLKRIDGTLQGDMTDIRAEGHPGIEFMASGKFNGRDAYLKGRFYLVGNRLYQVVAFGDKDKVSRSDIDQFMGSFKLTARHAVNSLNIDMTGDRMPPGK